ncbi:MAG: Hsp20/alpha crystallin family protein [Dyella sp.]
MTRPFFSYNPLGADSLRGFKREVNRWVGEATQAGERFFGPAGSPRIELSETENELMILVELPGLLPTDFQVELEDSRLHLHGEKPRPLLPSQQLRIDERRYGAFERSIQLPFAPALADIRARFEHGVLSIRVQKKITPRQVVPVQSQVGTAEPSVTEYTETSRASTEQPSVPGGLG